MREARKEKIAGGLAFGIVFVFVLVPVGIIEAVDSMLRTAIGLVKKAARR